MPCCGGWQSRIASRQLPAASELPAQGFELLPITLLHGLHAGGYPMAHAHRLEDAQAAEVIDLNCFAEALRLRVAPAG